MLHFGEHYIPGLTSSVLHPINRLPNFVCALMINVPIKYSELCLLFMITVSALARREIYFAVMPNLPFQIAHHKYSYF